MSSAPSASSLSVSGMLAIMLFMHKTTYNSDEMN